MALGIAIIVGIWLTGFAAGYGLREYISYQRRSHQRRRWPTAFDE
jgi:hypothetical protein